MCFAMIFVLILILIGFLCYFCNMRDLVDMFVCLALSTHGVVTIYLSFQRAYEGFNTNKSKKKTN